MMYVVKFRDLEVSKRREGDSEKQSERVSGSTNGHVHCDGGLREENVLGVWNGRAT